MLWDMRQAARAAPAAPAPPPSSPQGRGTAHALHPTLGLGSPNSFSPILLPKAVGA